MIETLKSEQVIRMRINISGSLKIQYNRNRCYDYSAGPGFFQTRL
jgi:hypothetical protein